TAPKHAAGVVNVRITTPGGTSAIVAADRYAYVAPPKVTALSPATGPAPGGTLVTITGANLARASAVIFGTSAATSVTVVSATNLRLQVSQRGLADPTIAAADRAAYLQRVEAGVSLARGNGFDVILSMQDQSIGCGPAHPFPTQLTLDAWNVLAPVYAADRYV